MEEKHGFLDEYRITGELNQEFLLQIYVSFGAGFRNTVLLHALFTSSVASCPYMHCSRVHQSVPTILFSLFHLSKRIRKLCKPEYFAEKDILVRF